MKDGKLRNDAAASAGKAVPARGRGRPALDGELGVDQEKCLRVALAAFAENGFDGTSIREIARTLGVSHGLLGAKFGSKRGLWEASVSHGMEALHAHMSQLPPAAKSGDVRARMAIACRNFVIGLAEVPAIIQLMNVEGARRSDRLDHIASSFFRGRVWPIQLLLAEGQAAGVFRPMHPAVPFTLLAHGAGALIALRPLVDATDARVRGAAADPLEFALEAADLIVRGMLIDGGAGETARQS